MILLLFQVLLFKHYKKQKLELLQCEVEQLRKRLTELFGQHELVVYGHASEPTYFGGAVPAWRVAQLADRLTPPALAPTLMVFVHKR